MMLIALLSANELSQLIQTASQRVKTLQAEMKKPLMAPEKVEEHAQQMATVKLEQLVLIKLSSELGNEPDERDGSLWIGSLPSNGMNKICSDRLSEV
jgi:hypothetical protein